MPEKVHENVSSGFRCWYGSLVAVHFLSDGVIELPFDSMSVNEPVITYNIPATVKWVVLVDIGIKFIIAGRNQECITQVDLTLYAIAVSVVKPVAELLYKLGLNVSDYGQQIL